MLPKCRCVDLIVKPYQVNPYLGLGAPGRHGPQSGYNICNSTTVGIRLLDFCQDFHRVLFWSLGRTEFVVSDCVGEFD